MNPLYHPPQFRSHALPVEMDRESVLLRQCWDGLANNARAIQEDADWIAAMAIGEHAQRLLLSYCCGAWRKVLASMVDNCEQMIVACDGSEVGRVAATMRVNAMALLKSVDEAVLPDRE